MAETITPTSPAQLRDAIVWAQETQTPLEIIGQGSKRIYGHAVAAEHVLNLSKLSGILFYEPGELVLSARAGTPLSDIHAALAEKKQQFHFEPVDFPVVLDGAAAPLSGTLGGLVACNLAGPRRLKVGAARDHVLGFEAVSGRGEDFKSGGRVMKNVTGFDLSKLMAGSFGTLGVMHSITIKIMPCDEKTRTVLVGCDDPVLAGSAMTAALTSENEVSAAAWVPASHAAKTGGGDRVAAMGGGVVAVRVEGPGPSVAWRCDALRKLLSSFGPTEALHSTNSLALWRDIANVGPFAGRDDILWRLSVPPASGGNVARQICDQTGAEVMLDWGGGLIWAQLPGDDAAQADIVRQIAVGAGGQATLIRASATLRAAIPVFHPQDPAIAALNERIRENFDPRHVLNPGRLDPARGA
ncbi:FAD-binding protein [Thalassospira sp.]|uniref:FAD-binding protein n=1 Tax=Thalassospira sp. TaxID=1912094 RepID=UPI0027343291|nr:FAD-binding protein [Thalassospira sp.]MDP2698850.1 FAD-binding protein [Thalassospira sp.]